MNEPDKQRPEAPEAKAIQSPPFISLRDYSPSNWILIFTLVAETVIAIAVIGLGPQVLPIFCIYIGLLCIGSASLLRAALRRDNELTDFGSCLEVLGTVFVCGLVTFSILIALFALCFSLTSQPA